VAKAPTTADRLALVSAAGGLGQPAMGVSRSAINFATTRIARRMLRAGLVVDEGVEGARREC
jgi:hypothetical protein